MRVREKFWETIIISSSWKDHLFLWFRLSWSLQCEARETAASATVHPYWDSIQSHRWAIDGPSMAIATFSDFELSPSAWGQLWSIFGLNISNFNLLSFPFEHEQAFSSLKITYIGALSLNCLKIDSENTLLYQKIWTFYLENQKKPGRIAIIRRKMRRNQPSIAEKTICL